VEGCGVVAVAGAEVRAAAVDGAEIPVVEVFLPAAVILAAAAPGVVGDMKPKVFINQVDDAKVVDAIARAERQTSGEIRVFISEHEALDALAEAKKQFTLLGMQKTEQRNGVLIFIAPKSQTFAVVGDVGVHTKSGDNFWDTTTGKMRALFKDGKLTEALLAGIESIGEVLKEHFPCAKDDRNELPNELEGG
jgi:uncharacterized membrane protein